VAEGLRIVLSALTRPESQVRALLRPHQFRHDASDPVHPGCTAARGPSRFRLACGLARLSLVQLSSPVAPFTDATISVKTAPAASCAITVLYKSGPSRAKGSIRSWPTAPASSRGGGGSAPRPRRATGPAW